MKELLKNYHDPLPGTTGVFIGSTLGESSTFEKAAKNSTMDFSIQNAGAWVESIANTYQLKGPKTAFGNACAAGNYAIGQAARYMKHYDIPVSIAGAAEPFSRIAMTGFSRSRAMSFDYCKPFDVNRNGMILGEGAAFFILEKESFALARNAQPLGVVNGLGLSCDAYNSMAPRPDGQGMKEAMYKSIQHSNLRKEDIDCICAHGSGTVASDVAEANAIVNLFDQYQPIVCAYKGALGHSMGAATAIEAAICLKIISTGSVASTTNCRQKCNEKLNVCMENTKTKINHVMNCGYAFGGINSSLIISKYH